MAEIKKETNKQQDILKTFNNISEVGIKELSSLIKGVKDTSSQYLDILKQKKEKLQVEVDKAKEQEALKEEVKEVKEEVQEEKPQEVVESKEETKEKEVVEPVVNEKKEEKVEETKPEEKVEVKAPEVPSKEEKPQEKVEEVKPVVDEPKKVEKKKKEKQYKIESDNPNIAQTEEILPNGEKRRIYIPPTQTQSKPKNIKTKVFANGENTGKNRNNRNNNQQAQGGQFNRRPNDQKPRLDSKPIMDVQFPPTKNGNHNSKNNKNNNNNNNSHQFDDSKMNKRALLKKGYIDDRSREYMDDEDDVRVRNYPKKPKSSQVSSHVDITHAVITQDPVSIKVLSETIGKTGAEIIKTLFFLGIVKTINESIDFDTAELVSGEFGITLELQPEATLEESLEAKDKEYREANKNKYITRPPVVTIMGHVDHGKTSLLDYIRKAHVTSGEAGGITQHIGAYTVQLNGQPITFLDTPGHEAFTSMRLRGAQVTDIAVLVVAADDGIMPQTIEAISHAKVANVPIVVAVNKIDKPTAEPDKVLQQLTEHDLLPEEWGGDVPVVKVSAKTGQGVDSLLETILLVAEMRELTADPTREARGNIIEAKIDKGLGKIATILVQDGTLHVGDNVVAGVATGKIRLMLDDKGKAVKVAGPSKAVSVTGWDDLPEAGDSLICVENDKFARDLAMERKLKQSENHEEDSALSLNDLFDKIKMGELKSVKLIVKADVQGSLEAVKQSLVKCSTDEVTIDIIHGAVGAIKESDVTLAETAKAIIIGFNVRPDQKARTLAHQKKIDIRMYDVIYDAIEDVEKAVKGLLEPTFEEEILGSAEVRETFKISGVGVIAGSYVTEGKIVRGSKCRLVRDGKVEYTGEIASLRHGKDDVKEMAKNFECGISLLNYQDIKTGDVIEAYKMVEVNE